MQKTVLFRNLLIEIYVFSFSGLGLQIRANRKIEISL